MPRTARDPRTKEEFLSRLLSYDFQGDIRQVGEFPASLIRTGPNKLEITFPKSGVTFELVVRRPRLDSLETEMGHPRIDPSHRSFANRNPPAPPPAPEPEAQPERPRRKYTRRQAPGART